MAARVGNGEECRLSVVVRRRGASRTEAQRTLRRQDPSASGHWKWCERFGIWPALNRGVLVTARWPAQKTAESLDHARPSGAASFAGGAAPRKLIFESLAMRRRACVRSCARLGRRPAYGWHSRPTSRACHARLARARNAQRRTGVYGFQDDGRCHLRGSGTCHEAA